MDGFASDLIPVERVTLEGVLVIGAGLAGLSAALAAAPTPCLVLSPTALGEGCSSAWAQGGMAVALSPDDDADLHAADTLAAGAGLCDPDRVELLTREGRAAVERLIALGAPFDRDPAGRLVQSLEAAHSRARVARVGGDGAGRAIMQAVISAARATPSISLLAPARARRLITGADGAVIGALVEHRGRLTALFARAVILASGGVGGLFAETTTPAQVRGEGMGLAALAGAVIRDPEFVQFHPTAMDFGQDPAPLATEALRGEGAVLIDAEGGRFMLEADSRAELAPRDIVARAIHRQRREGKGAFLDARQAVGAHFPHEFPSVFAACIEAGLDPRLSPIPVAPAVHYHMGGIETDADGRTSLKGLYAAGECASAGVHGANRLASNSLLEAAVFGTRAGCAAAAELSDHDPSQAGLAPQNFVPLPDLTPEALAELRAAMSREAGVERDAAGLERLGLLIARLVRDHGPSPVLAAAALITEGALARRSSLGAHFRLDHPETPDEARSSHLALSFVAPLARFDLLRLDAARARADQQA